MKAKNIITAAALAAIIAAAPLTSASAHDHWDHGGRGLGIFALGAAAVVGTAAILSLPFEAAAAPAPAYPPQAYYAPPQPAYYTQAPVYYAPQPVYYAPAPAYYYGRPVYYR